MEKWGPLADNFYTFKMVTQDYDTPIVYQNVN